MIDVTTSTGSAKLTPSFLGGKARTPVPVGPLECLAPIATLVTESIRRRTFQGS